MNGLLLIIKASMSVRLDMHVKFDSNPFVGTLTGDNVGVRLLCPATIVTRTVMQCTSRSRVHERMVRCCFMRNRVFPMLNLFIFIDVTSNM